MFTAHVFCYEASEQNYGCLWSLSYHISHHETSISKQYQTNSSRNFTRNQNSCSVILSSAVLSVLCWFIQSLAVLYSLVLYCAVLVLFSLVLTCVCCAVLCCLVQSCAVFCCLCCLVLFLFNNLHFFHCLVFLFQSCAVVCCLLQSFALLRSSYSFLQYFAVFYCFSVILWTVLCVLCILRTLVLSYEVLGYCFLSCAIFCSFAHSCEVLYFWYNPA